LTAAAALALFADILGRPSAHHLSAFTRARWLVSVVSAPIGGRNHRLRRVGPFLRNDRRLLRARGDPDIRTRTRTVLNRLLGPKGSLGWHSKPIGASARVSDTPPNSTSSIAAPTPWRTTNRSRSFSRVVTSPRRIWYWPTSAIKSTEERRADLSPRGSSDPLSHSPALDRNKGHIAAHKAAWPSLLVPSAVSYRNPQLMPKHSQKRQRLSVEKPPDFQTSKATRRRDSTTPSRLDTRQPVARV